MRKTVTKKLRAILNPETSAVAKRVYRRAKKSYNKVPANAKSEFIEGLKQLFEMEGQQYRGTLAEGERQG